MQLRSMRDAVKLLDTRNGAQCTVLSWPSDAYATQNFCDAVPSPTLWSPDFVRRPGFLVLCADGSTLLLSEREAHGLLCARHEACASGAAQCMTIVHLALVRAAAAPLRSAPRVATNGVVAAQLFAGESLFQDAGPGAAGEICERDTARMARLKSVLLDGAANGDAIGARAAAAKQLLAHRGREKHFPDSCVDTVCTDGAADAREAQRSKSRQNGRGKRGNGVQGASRRGEQTADGVVRVRASRAT